MKSDRQNWQSSRFQSSLGPLLSQIKIRAASLEERRQQLVAYHNLGKKLNARMPERLGHGDEGIATLAAALGRGPGLLYKARDFAKLFEPSELETLLKHADQIRWTHVVHLIGVKDRANRIKFLKRAAREKWTAARLHRAIKEHYGKRRGGGRPPAALARQRTGPALEQLQEATETWLRRFCTEAGSGPPMIVQQLGDRRLKRQLRSLDPSAIDTAASSLDRLARAAKQAATAVRGARSS